MGSNFQIPEAQPNEMSPRIKGTEDGGFVVLSIQSEKNRIYVYNSAFNLICRKSYTEDGGYRR